MKTRYEEIEEAAVKFHRENPKVWECFVRFTFEVIHRGFRNYSAKGVFERIRWETDEADVDGKSTFKLNNHYSAFFARWFMDTYPEHDGFFRLREMPSELQLAKNLPELGPQDFPELKRHSFEDLP